jgi:hypothetical protein
VRLRGWTPVLVAAAFIAISMPHVFEDIASGERPPLGMSVVQIGFVAGILHGALILAALNAAMGGKAGPWAMIVIALVWLTGMVLVHGPELAHTGYVHGTLASTIILGAMFVLVLALAGAGLRFLFPPR